jgi:hypothetical protein
LSHGREGTIGYQPSKFPLIFNLKTAEAIGFDLPANLIAALTR